MIDEASIEPGLSLAVSTNSRFQYAVNSGGGGHAGVGVTSVSCPIAVRFGLLIHGVFRGL